MNAWSGFWGAVLGGGVFSYFLTNYLIANQLGAALGFCGRAMSRSGEGGSFDVLSDACVAFADPTSSFVDKLAPIAITHVGMAAVLGGLYSWAAHKFDWFDGEEAAVFWVGAVGALAGFLFLQYQGDEDLVGYFFSFKWISGAS